MTRRNYRDQFGGAHSSRCRHCLPSVFPEARWGTGEVSKPVALIRSLNRKQLTPVSNQGHLDLHSRIGWIRSSQGEASRSHFTDQLTLSVVPPGLPCSHLLKRLLRFVLIGSEQRDNLSPFLLELRQEFSCHSFPIHQRYEQATGQVPMQRVV